MTKPKGARNVRTLIHELANMTVIIKDADGGSRKVLVKDALIMKAQQLAMTGDIPANKNVDRLRNRLIPEDQPQSGILLTPEPLSDAEWIRRQTIRNKFRHEPIYDAGPPKGEPPSPNAVNKPVKKPGGDGSGGKDPPGPDMRGRVFR